MWTLFKHPRSDYSLHPHMSVWNITSLPENQLAGILAKSSSNLAGLSHHDTSSQSSAELPVKDLAEDICAFLKGTLLDMQSWLVQYIVLMAEVPGWYQ